MASTTTDTQPDEDHGAAFDRRYWLRDVKDPRSPVGRSKLGELIDYDHRTAERHRTVWKFHLGWAHKDYAWTSLASVRTIRDVLLGRSPTGKALSTRLINEANRQLVELGYLTELEKGSGHRGTRYAINWDLLNQAAAGHFPFSVSPVGYASVSPVGNAKAASVSPVGHKDPTTPTRRETGLGVVGASTEAGGSPDIAPPHHGPRGPDGDSALGRFDLLWQAYGDHKDSALAEAEFDRLDPSPDLFAKLLDRAAHWKATYDTHNQLPAYRKTLRRWLAEKRWREEPKFRPLSDRTGAATPPVDAQPTAPVAPAPQHCRIVSATVRDGDEGSVLTLTMQPVTGDAPIVRNLRHQTWEAAEVDALLSAAGLQAGADSDELEGREVVVDGRWYLPVPANDNDGEAASPASPSI